MISIVYVRATGMIIGIVPNVVSASDTEVIGTNDTLRGITVDLAGVLVIESTMLEIGDKINPSDYTDLRSNLPKTDSEKISELEQLVASLQLGV